MTAEKTGESAPEDGRAITIDNLIEVYCRETVLRPASKDDYVGAAHIFQRDTSVVKISAVTHDVVVDWRDKILGCASTATWNTYRRQMKTVFNFAVKRGWLQTNHFKEWQPTWPRGATQT